MTPSSLAFYEQEQLINNIHFMARVPLVSNAAAVRCAGACLCRYLQSIVECRSRLVEFG